MSTQYRIELQNTKLPLGIGAVFTSATHNVETYNHIRGVVSSDQNGTLVIKQGSESGAVVSVTTMNVVGGVPAKFDDICYGLFAQIVYTNGGVAQGTFYLTINGDPFK